MHPFNPRSKRQKHNVYSSNFIQNDKIGTSMYNIYDFKNS